MDQSLLHIILSIILNSHSMCSVYKFSVMYVLPSIDNLQVDQIDQIEPDGEGVDMKQVGARLDRTGIKHFWCQ